MAVDRDAFALADGAGPLYEAYGIGNVSSSSWRTQIIGGMNGMRGTPTTTGIADRYREYGYFLPFVAVDESTARNLRADLEDAEQSLAGDRAKSKLLRQYPHLLLPAFDSLIRTPVLVDLVAQLIGPDLLVWGCSLFIKEPGTTSIVSWHQDLTYWGLDDANEVTAWVALSPSTPESGAMRYIPGSHRQAIVAHVDTFSEDNLLSRGQEIAVDVDESEAVTVVLGPGQATFHHGRLFHASGPNVSSDRRIGVAIRYIDPAMKQVDGEKPLARHVAGSDRFGHFRLTDGPRGRLSDIDFERCHADLELRESFLFKDARSN